MTRAPGNRAQLTLDVGRILDGQLLSVWGQDVPNRFRVEKQVLYHRDTPGDRELGISSRLVSVYQGKHGNTRQILSCPFSQLSRPSDRFRTTVSRNDRPGCGCGQQYVHETLIRDDCFPGDAPFHEDDGPTARNKVRRPGQRAHRLETLLRRTHSHELIALRRHSVRWR